MKRSIRKILCLILSAVILASMAVFGAISAGAVKIIIGDVNGDGQIRVADVLMMQNYIAKKIDLSERNLLAADVNGDSFVKVNDVLLVQQYIAKNIDKFPVPDIEDPTEDPTAEPTQAPTEKPTAEPTQDPTEEPTAEPTQAPTEKPTAEPTQDPTEEPTAEPTQAPTEKPTAEPTQAPTEKPTAEPTQAPTEKPTAEPTQAPTEKPTAEPTQAPTEKPTAEPTQAPTQPPTKAQVTVNGITAQVGDTIKVVFHAKGVNDIAQAIQAYVQYDADVLLLTGYDLSTWNNVVDNNTQAGKLYWTASDISEGFNITDETDIVTLTFKVKDTNVSKVTDVLLQIDEFFGESTGDNNFNFTLESDVSIIK